MGTVIRFQLLKQLVLRVACVNRPHGLVAVLELNKEEEDTFS